MQTKISVLSSTFNRAPLLDRALATYLKQTLDPRYWEYVLVDDGSQDDTLKVVKKYQKLGLPIKVYDVAKDLGRPKEPGKWRDGSIGRNAGSTMCTGEVLVCTHPEIMVHPDSLEMAYESVMRQPTAWHTAIPYWMPDESDPDSVDWQSDLANLRNVPGFYSPDWPSPSPTHPIDYRNQNQERRRDWESEVWWAIEMRLWRQIGGLREFEVWGPVDVDFMNRRRAIHIPTRLITSPRSEAQSGTLMVYHQWHPSPRNMELCMDTLRKHGCIYSCPDDAVKAGGLSGTFLSGPREREFGKREVMGDHIDRYRFASQYSEGMTVLDCPCGTGYGSKYLGNAYRYVGMDLDAESIQWANRVYGSGNCEFYQGSMCAMPFRENTFDRVFCFEGVEHVQEQKQFFKDLMKVLKPNGTFIISTPQKGVTPGTPWDKYMLTADELYTLAQDAGFNNLDWFHQRNYGGAIGMNPVVAGKPTTEDAIMILGGQKPGDME